MNSKIPTNNQFFGLDVKEHIEDEELVNAANQDFQTPAETQWKESRKASAIQDQIEASSKIISKAINSDNIKQSNQIKRKEVKVAIVSVIQ